MAKNNSLDNGGFIEKGNPEANTKAEKKDAKKTKKNKEPNFFQKIGAKIKDIFSELKKVSWPSFGKVLKETGIVIAVVLIFLVIITAFDSGLLALLRLISPNV